MQSLNDTLQSEYGTLKTVQSLNGTMNDTLELTQTHAIKNIKHNVQDLQDSLKSFKLDDTCLSLQASGNINTLGTQNDDRPIHSKYQRDLTINITKDTRYYMSEEFETFEENHLEP